MTRYTMYCPACHGSFTVRGIEEEDTNAFIPNEEDLAEHQEAMGCLHEDAFVAEVDYDGEP